MNTCKPPKKPWRSFKRWAIFAAVAAGVLLLAELTARWGLGLGDPPLSRADAELEYLVQPNQDCRRFGNQIFYNQYSMRSRSFPRQKNDSREIRVLCLGDSVINGGSLTDQADLATSLLEKRLTEELRRPVVVGNVSAGSWGPPNLLAYTRKFGWFDADLVVLVLSSHDAEDVPTFEPLVGVAPEYPNTRPQLALQEAVTRYLWPRLFPKSQEPSEASPNDTETHRQLALDALRQLLIEAQASGATVLVCQHLENEELDSGKKAGHQAIFEVVREQLASPPIQLGPALEQARRNGPTPYRDHIHLNEVGQQVLADALLPPILEALAADAEGRSSKPLKKPARG